VILEIQLLFHKYVLIFYVGMAHFLQNLLLHLLS
jgi:hypothetical protein